MTGLMHLVKLVGMEPKLIGQRTKTVASHIGGLYEPTFVNATSAAAAANRLIENVGPRQTQDPRQQLRL